ncbi:pentatricopeptide repeat-containing protein At2g30780 [Ipomoea triloba]|uniref:pentatricopeptide repeat-containing protein At2g30780 n=1 Tax=Ipomoea triloba TaxID=35885 RepID=UPI00125E81E0|nr:pentatricopeptide repeat-containing protein At2g30780 [Ipomoea triloba]
MKRLLKITYPELFFHKFSGIPTKPYTVVSLVRASAQSYSSSSSSSPSSSSSSSQYVWPNVVGLFAGKWTYGDSLLANDLRDKVSKLRDELVIHGGDVETFYKVLEEKGAPMFRKYRDGSAVVELLTQLHSSPQLAIEVVNWRREMDYINPLTAEEYAKAISLAGRLHNVELASQIFREAADKRVRTTSMYNALMSAYMYNGLAVKCQSVFQDMKKEASCCPTIVTYNILISVFGRLLLVDHMEETFREIKDLNICPNVTTYNYLIAGYLTAWKWDDMEKTFRIMNAGSIEPNLTTYLLMLRGYAYAGRLEKMEETYELVKDHVDHKEISLIRTMISAYCRSSNMNRVSKVKELLKFIPENEYRPWLNVQLIILYAKEDLLEEMETSINEAFERNTSVTTIGVMKGIIACYFRNSAMDKLANFVKRAECGGWRICRSLYHCKMVMYSSHKRLVEMENVLDEMEKVNLDWTKRTLWILYKAYSKWGEKSKLEQVAGVMCKHGYGIPMSACSS